MSELEKPKRAVVTGGTEGIGRFITEQLLEQHLIVATCARTTGKIDKLHNLHPEVQVERVDLSDRRTADKFIKSAIDKLGGIDILILNAAHHGVPSKDETIAQAQERNDLVFRINQVAQVALTRASLEALRHSKGAVVFLTSGLAKINPPILGTEAYALSKQRIQNYLQDLIQKPENSGIFVFSVNPGPVDTGMHEFIINHAPDHLAQMSRAAKEKGVMSDPGTVGRIVSEMATTRMSFNPQTSEYDILIENGEVITISRENIEFESVKHFKK